jgi:GR25 family glycosyltransferase involved in LPS biosynthesis
MNLKNYFGGAFVLNLDRRPERHDAFLTRLRRLGVAGVERYRAVDGSKCPAPDWWGAGDAAWGCLMSHFRLAQDAIMSGLKSYVVFEDDAVFANNFCEVLTDVMDRVDSEKVEWDQLYLGGQHLFIESSPPWPFRKRLVRCANVNRTHAYAVSAKFMAKFCQHVMHAPDYIEANEGFRKSDQNNKSWHIDHQLGLLHERREDLILAIHPWVCGQASGESDIKGEELPEQWWRDEGWGK